MTPKVWMCVYTKFSIPLCVQITVVSIVISLLARHLRNRGPIRSNGEKFFYWKTPTAAPAPTHPSVQLRSRALSTGIERLVCEADHSLPSYAEGRNEMNFTLTLDMPPWIAQGLYIYLPRSALGFCIRDNKPYP